MELILIFIIGLCIGSFLNVCIYRIANGESIVFPSSHCMKCGIEIKKRDLIPVISYVLLKGKCRNCGDKISIRYPLIELTNGILYILLYLSVGFSLELFKGCIFISLLLVIAFIDFDTHEVYRSTTIFGMIVGIVFLVLNYTLEGLLPWNNIVGALIGYGIIWLIVILTKGMGEGDIDIAMICGLFLGIKGIILNLFLAFIIGGIVATILLILIKMGRKSEMAFGPYLAVGGIITLLYGSYIMEMYFRFFL